MDIMTKNENGVLTVALAGRLDTTSAPDLEKTITEQIPGAQTLVFDLAQLAYTSSAGLRIFLKAQKLMSQKGGAMKVLHVAEPIMEIFEMTGFTDILTIE